MNTWDDQRLPNGYVMTEYGPAQVLNTTPTTPRQLDEQHAQIDSLTQNACAFCAPNNLKQSRYSKPMGGQQND